MESEKPKNGFAVQHERLYAFLHGTYVRILKIRGEPREIALGMALGIFVAMSPTMGFQMAIAIFLAALFKWNKITAALGVWVSNPFTAPIIYGLTYLVGAKLFGLPEAHQAVAEGASLSRLAQMIHHAPRIFWALTVGGIIVGLPIAVVGYFFTYSAVCKYRHQIKATLALQKAKRARAKAEKLRRANKRKKGRSRKRKRF